MHYKYELKAQLRAWCSQKCGTDTWHHCSMSANATELPGIWWRSACGVMGPLGGILITRYFFTFFWISCNPCQPSTHTIYSVSRDSVLQGFAASFGFWSRSILIRIFVLSLYSRINGTELFSLILFLSPIFIMLINVSKAIRCNIICMFASMFPLNNNYANQKSTYKEMEKNKI